MTELATECKCTGPGECPVYKRTMRLREWELCSGNCPASRPCSDEVRSKYRRLWMEGRGGGPPTHPTLPGPRGPGTELKKLLASLGLKPGGCECNSRAAAMDQWGVEGCRNREWQILEW